MNEKIEREKAALRADLDFELIDWDIVFQINIQMCNLVDSLHLYISHTYSYLRSGGAVSLSGTGI